jgi:hypothetical protein
MKLPAKVRRMFARKGRQGGLARSEKKRAAGLANAAIARAAKAAYREAAAQAAAVAATQQLAEAQTTTQEVA